MTGRAARRRLALLVLSASVAGCAPRDPAAGPRSADHALARAAATVGLRGALEEWLDEGGVLVHAGAPVLVGRAAVLAGLARDPRLDSVTVSWEAAEVRVSSDGRFAITAGELSVTDSDGGPPRTGSYICAWRQVGGEWRVAGLMQTGLVPPGRNPTAGWTPGELPALAPEGAAAAMVQADLDFAALAAAEGAPAAFERFAAADGFTWAAPGLWHRGPAAIGEAIGRGPAADWSWHPVAASASAKGDLGFTVGEALIRPREGGNPVYSKYLTVWQRQADGAIRFLTDGGNPRPAPSP